MDMDRDTGKEGKRDTGIYREREIERSRERQSVTE